MLAPPSSLTMADGLDLSVARQVTRCILQKYSVLPKKGKPRHGEWTLVAAVICSIENGKTQPRAFPCFLGVAVTML